MQINEKSEFVPLADQNEDNVKLFLTPNGQPPYISVLDPLNKDSDVGKQSHNFGLLQTWFKQAHQQL